jgi:predicted DNA-binding transcriptional regulator AlpA
MGCVLNGGTQMLSLLLDIDDVAKLIKLSPATIENWAYGRKPAPAGFPDPIKVGRLLRYRRADIEVWIGGLGVPGNPAPSGAVAPLLRAKPKRLRGRPRKMEAAL